jgi:hypothetical protein
MKNLLLTPNIRSAQRKNGRKTSPSKSPVVYFSGKIFVDGLTATNLNRTGCFLFYATYRLSTREDAGSRERAVDEYRDG